MSLDSLVPVLLSHLKIWSFKLHLDSGFIRVSLRSVSRIDRHTEETKIRPSPSNVFTYFFVKIHIIEEHIPSMLQLGIDGFYL